jgi:hypothetical protein
VPGALAATPLCGTIKAVYMEAVHGAKPVATTRLRDRMPEPIQKLSQRLRRRTRAADAPEGTGHHDG